MLARLGAWSYRRPWRVVGGWVFALVLLIAASGGLGGPKYLENFELPDSDSASGIDVLTEKFAGALGSGYEASIVYQSTADVRDDSIREPMEKLFGKVAEIEGFVVSSPYSPESEAFQISEDGHTAFARLTIDADLEFTELTEIGKEIRSYVPKIKGTEVVVGGNMLADFAEPKAELIGLAFAIIVLIVSFGSVLAMGLPIAVALAGVGLGAVLVTVASHATAIPELSTIIGTMIGLGVGIDYALFIVTRYREQLHTGHTGEESASIALDTAGRAVLFAGMTVVISLLGMLAIGLSFIGGMGVSAALTVTVTMIASVTLLPALLGFAKERVERTRWRGLISAGFVSLALLFVGLNLANVSLVFIVLAVIVLLAGFAVAPLRKELKPRQPKPADQTLSYRWSHTIQRHPWISMIAAAGVLIVMAIPVTSLRVGTADEGNAPEGTDMRRAYDLLVEGFGPGFNGPLIVATEGMNLIQAMGAMEKMNEAEGVATVIGPIPSNMEEFAASGLGDLMGGGEGESDEPVGGGILPTDPDELLAYDISALTESEFAAALPENLDELLTPAAIMFQVIPDTSPQSIETEELIARLRADVVPSVTDIATGAKVHVTGNTAVNVDFSTYLSGRTPLFFGVVLALSFLLLMAVFRSILVPLKAVVMNLLSIGAAYGVVVAIFQWGWGSGLFGVEPAPIEPFLPVMMFAIVFGLSMDYEVFLLSRVKEEFDRTGDARTSVADGLAATARVITAAAAIMVVVFGSFLFEDDRVVKSFGVGLAVAVLLDASLVRMLLVPATMELLGEKNWWFPKWLDRIIPTLNVEGGSHPEPENPTTAG